MVLTDDRPENPATGIWNRESSIQNPSWSLYGFVIKTLPQCEEAHELNERNQAFPFVYLFSWLHLLATD
jgi:hypothetical protein